MYTKTFISNDNKRAIVLRSFHHPSKTRSKATQSKPRSISTFGTKSYNDALQRAFNRAKQQIFFNPDMNQFVTLTYRGVDHTPEQVLHDVKMLVKRESRRDRAKRGEIKYIFVMEYQKRGSIHVHMITNDFLSLQVNKNGYKEVAFWQKGFSSVLQIKDFDNNFRPYLYLFKYMRKAQRIGKSFIHASRNLNNFEQLPDLEFDMLQWNTVNQEHTSKIINDKKLTFIRTFLHFDDTMSLST